MFDELPPPNMPDSDPQAGDWDEPTEGRSWLRNCLFVAVSLLMVCTLVSTSLLGAFLVRREIARSNTPPTVAALAPLPTRVMPEPVVTVAAATAAATVTAAAEPAEAASGAIDAIPTPAPTTPAGLPGRIALVSPEGQIETVAADGRDGRALTRRADGNLFQFPTWSPDGQSLAVVGTSTQGGGIYVLDDLADAQQSLEDDRVYFSRSQTPFYLYWSPDGTQISFLANHSRDLFGLNLVPEDGSAESRLMVTGSPIYWEWSRDSGAMLVHSTANDNSAEVAWLGTDGSSEPTDVERPGFFQTPGISPSGRYLTIAESAGRESTLVVVDVDSGERMPYDTYGSLAMNWSPTIDLLAFTGGALDQHPYWGTLRLLDPASGQVKTLTTETVLAFFWSPDGRQLAYITLNQRSPGDDVNAQLPDALKTRRLGKGTMPVQSQGSGFLRLSVIDATTGRGLRLLDFQPTAIFVSQFLPFYPQYSLSHRLWSPDSRSIVLPIQEDSAEMIVVIPTNGGSAKAIAEGDIAFWSPR